jgi:glycosyltransferase involved in cell wall biosynthesis
MFDNVRTVIINYQTPDLLTIAVESFRRYYPKERLLIIDNGSKDKSSHTIEKLEKITPDQTTSVRLESNIYHGPAMHHAMNIINEEMVLFLDSDTETKRGGFIENMLKEFELSSKLYGIGQILSVNKRGFQEPTGEQVLAPAYMMVRRNIYFELKPFEHHGLPVLINNMDAREKGYELKSFPIEKYIDHRWRGTASRYGYGLGWRGKKEFLLNKLGI